MIYIYSIGAPALLAAILVGIWWFINRHKKHEVKTTVPSVPSGAVAKVEFDDILPKRKVNLKQICVYFDIINHRWYDKVKITASKAAEIETTWHSLGMEFSAFGAKQYLLNRYATYDKDSNATIRERPVQVLLTSTAKTPTELYNVIMQHWVTPALPLSVKKSALQQLMPILIWSAVLLFIGFAWSNS